MYARLSPDGIELESYPATRPRAVLFIDLNLGFTDCSQTDRIMEAVEKIRELSPAGLGNVSTVLFRWPDLSTASIGIKESKLDRVWEQIGQSLDGMNLAASAGLVHAPLGSPPSVSWGTGSLAPGALASPEENVSSLNWRRWLLACREVELTALLQNGRGIWRPRYYHYRLPSGRHSATFVRLGDAIKSVRDADVLAWWLHEHATEDLGVVLDTATIVPIVLALRNSMRSIGMRLGQVVSLASYPATKLEFVSAVGRARSGQHSTLALLSVNSSGSVRDRLLDALNGVYAKKPEDADQSDEVRDTWALHTFVDKSGAEPHHLDKTRVYPDQQTSVWSRHGEGTETVAESCVLCNDSSRSRAVQIDPKSFDGLVLPDPMLVTPDIRVADSARAFWHLCDQTGALSLDDDPHPSVARIRPHGRRMGVVIDFEKLLKRDDSLDGEASLEQHDASGSSDSFDAFEALFAASVDRIDQQHHENKKSARVSSRSAIDFVRSAELIVGLEDEFGRAEGRGREFVERVVASWNPDATIAAFNLEDEEENAQLEPQVRSSGTVCIFVLGVVTGTSLHRIFAWIQDVRRKSGLGRCEVGVFVLHFRPDLFACTKRHHQSIRR